MYVYFLWPLMRTRGEKTHPDCILGKLFHLKRNHTFQVKPKSLTGNIQVELGRYVIVDSMEAITGY